MYVRENDGLMPRLTHGTGIFLRIKNQTMDVQESANSWPKTHKVPICPVRSHSRQHTHTHTPHSPSPPQPISLYTRRTVRLVVAVAVLWVILLLVGHGLVLLGLVEQRLLLV